MKLKGRGATIVRRMFGAVFGISGLLWGCTQQQRIYESKCNEQASFRKVTFRELMDHLSDYQGQFVEVRGIYQEDKAWSALVDDSLRRGQVRNDALWVNFSQDCPLYLKGTRQGLFEYNEGGFTQINSRSVTLRGRIDLHNRGSRGQCRGTIDRISLVRL